MKHTHRKQIFLAFTIAATLSAAAAFPVPASGKLSMPLLTEPVGTAEARPVSMVEAETLNFFFDDLDGLLGARILDRNSKESGKIVELIVEKDGTVSSMVVEVPLDETRSAIASIAEWTFVANNEAFVRRKASTDDLVVLETLSGGKIVKVEDHIADLHDFPEFTPTLATDSF